MRNEGRENKGERQSQSDRKEDQENGEDSTVAVQLPHFIEPNRGDGDHGHIERIKNIPSFDDHVTYRSEDQNAGYERGGDDELSRRAQPGIALTIERVG